MNEREQNGKINRLTSGVISHEIMRLAWPTMLAMVLETLFTLIDAFWVGKLGADALAAVSASAFILWAVFSISHIAATGVVAIVSQHRGADEKAMADHAGVQGIYLAVILGMLIAVIGIFAMPALFSIMQLSATVHLLSRQYMIISLAGVCIAFAFIAVEAVFRASGDTRTPTVILLICLVINAVLDPLLIFGWLGFPALGVRGAAAATILAFGFGLILIVLMAISRGFLPAFSMNSWKRADMAVMKTIVRVGAPIAITGFSFSFVYIFLTRIITHFGTAPLAAIGLGHRLEGIAYLTSVGFSIAASTMVGQNIGAGNFKRAERAAWLSTLYASVAMGFFSMIVIFFSRSIITLFITDEEVVLLGMQYLIIIACCEVFLAFEVVLEGAFSGAGNTVPPMLISIPLTALRIPFAYYFSIHLDFGVMAIWWTISLSTLCKGTLMVYWFSRGKWKQRPLVRTQTIVPSPVTIADGARPSI